MNRRGQTSIWTVIVIIGLFVVVFMFGLSQFQNTVSDQIITDQNPTGLWGFFIGNLAFFTFLFFIITILWKMFAG